MIKKTEVCEASLIKAWIITRKSERREKKRKYIKECKKGNEEQRGQKERAKQRKEKQEGYIYICLAFMLPDNDICLLREEAVLINIPTIYFH